MVDVQLEFAEYTPAAFAAALLPQIAAGARRLRFRPYNDFARQVATLLTSHSLDLILDADATAGEAALPSGIQAADPDRDPDLTVLCSGDSDHLAAQLLEYLDTDRCRLLAPITQYHFKSRPLFLISIPKSGTHLLYEFAHTLGYEHGFTCPILPDPGIWYFIQSEHSHTRATDFLGETPWHAPFANRHHPFVRSPALFIYRNPLDILISEANWYHQDGTNVFAGYFSGLSFEERLLKLIDDPWLLGTIRDRVGAFIAWLDLPNVIPVSFEEIVGSKGGGDATRQLRLIWSLQLKLQVPGAPAAFAKTIFNPNSPTFRAGQIGGYRTKLTPQAQRKFLALPQDFMTAYGYDGPDVEHPLAIPRHAERFRTRPLTVSAVDHAEAPIMLEHGYLEHNLVLFRGRVFALPWSLGPFDLPQAQPQQLANLLQGSDLNELKQRVLRATRYVNRSPVRVTAA
jgi:hypothetical protein